MTFQVTVEASAYAYVAGDTIGVAWDVDNKRLWFAKMEHGLEVEILQEILILM